MYGCLFINNFICSQKIKRQEIHTNHNCDNKCDFFIRYYFGEIKAIFISLMQKRKT